MVDTGISIAVPEGTCTLSLSVVSIQPHILSPLSELCFLLSHNHIPRTLSWYSCLFVTDAFNEPDGRIAPRSGLAAKHSIDTGAGVIDYDYRGPVKVILFNFSDTPFSISTGDRIAQLVLERIVTPEVSVVQELKETARGGGGFGSTGGFGDAVKSVAHVTAAV